MTAAILESIPAWFGVGAGGGFGFYTIKWVIEYFGGRMDKQRAALDHGTQQLIEGLEKRLNAVTERMDRVEHDLIECRTKHAESEAEVMRLKAIMQGAGEVREHVQRIVAAEKQGAKQ